MKTTVHIAPDLLQQAKTIAAAERTTLRALIDEGLREALAKREASDRFALRDASFAGRGLQPGLDEGDWQRLMELAYEGRGA